MSILAFVRQARVQESLSFILINALLVLSLPVPSRAQVVTPGGNGNEDKGQVRKEMPHKNLPSLTDLQDEAKGIQKVKAKDAPLQPSKLCRLRDADCLAKQKATGIQIGANVPAVENDATKQQVTKNTKPGWLQRLKQKVTGALTGSGLSTATTPTGGGNSFVPTGTAMASRASAPAAPVFAPPAFTSLNDAKLDPHNRIGTGSEDLFSGNIHWSTPLVSLPGRNGLDLNLTLHYNSLQWVKFGSTMYFDPDWKTSYPVGLSNGFNLGFPEIESGFVYKTTATDTTPAYVVTLPSGYRVPLRRVYLNGSQQRYEAVDGSNLYLTLQSGQLPTLYLPDGTQYSYGTTFSGTGTYRCTMIRDSNGNKITIAYNSTGISTITDTLGRVLNFNYDANFHLQTITQNWNGTTHIWAQFDYGTKLLNYSFPGFTIDGPANNTNLSVLTRVITSDGARHTFAYNGWGIAEDFFLYGEADNQRSFLDYGFPAPGPLTDCPRFGQRDDNIFGWGGAVYNATTGFGRVTSTFQFDANEAWGQVTTPDGVVHKELFSATGGTRGLTTGMETLVSGVKTKWTATTWQSDGTNYPFYPRVIATDVYDDVNGNGVYNAGVDNYNHTAQSYSTFTKTQAQSTMPYTVYLPFQTTQYDASGTTVYRYTQTDYLDDSNYWNRRIIGLPTEQRLYDGGNVLQAKTAFSYDQLGLAGFGTTPVQFDATNYSSSFVWRGNLTNTKRYSVVSGTAGTYTETKAYYFITGSVADTYDALNRHTLFDYQDSYATYADDASNTETVKTLANKTYAFPTYIQDPGGYISTLKYWYDTGAPTKTVNPKGAAAISIYEAAHGRLLKAKNMVNSAYTRYIYAADHNSAQSLTTVNSTSIETSNITVFDGIGRTRVNVSEHPGSTGGSSSAYQVYDIMGRVVEWSNPTEIDNTWAPAGDDSTGYKYSRQDYDWKGRPTITYNQDYNVSTNPLSKRQISYTGCGCAGGQVTTVMDEMQRMQKSYADFLGRTYKTEVYNGAAVYSSTQTTFNVLDLVTNITEYAGAVGSGGVSQATAMTYDGYGRLWTRQRPQETGPTTYSYYANDQLQGSIDARGATGTLTYNTRGLLTQATYTTPTGVAATPTVTFQYDEVGNRTLMDDGPGQVTYQYNTLSQLTQETRTFDALPNQSYTLSYEYNLGGKLTKITDPSNSSVSYALDKTGRVTDITGSAFGGITQYATGINYRAWGVPKAVAYGSGFAASASYNSRLQVTQFDIPGVIGGTYAYNLDGQINTFSPSTPLSNQYDWRLGRSFTYDPMGRLSTSYATGIPYSYNPTFDEFSNVKAATYLYWQNGSSDVQFSATFQNNRGTNVTDAGQAQTWNYDAMGNRTSITKTVNGTNTTVESIAVDAVGRAANQALDGEGQVVVPVTGYYIRSRALGGRISTLLDYTGTKSGSYVYDGGNLLAEQIIFTNGDTTVRWHHRDPHNLVARDTEPAQLKRNSFAINPVGAQIQSTEGVNTAQYYACMYGGANNPTCSGFTPQPPGGYGAAADQAMGAFVAGLKVDGALTLGSVAGAIYRAGVHGDSIYVSPGLAGTPTVTSGTWQKVERWKDIDTGDPQQITAQDDSYYQFLPGSTEPQETFTITYQHTFISQPTFDKCYQANLANTNIKNTPFDRGRATLALAAATQATGGTDVNAPERGNDAAMVAAIWHKESFLEYRPDGDAGPAQLTSWWKTNHPELIVGDSYGSWKGRTKNIPFDGNPVDNISTLGNIVAFNRNLFKAYDKIPYWYGPGDPEHPKNAPKKRAEYRDQVMPNFQLYSNFFDCILKQ